MGWFHNIETFHKEKSGVLKNKPRKQKFYCGSPSLGIVISKKTNKYCLLFSKQESQIFSNISYLKQFTPKKMGGEVLILSNS